MESGLFFHSHSPSFHRWPFSCSLLTPSLRHSPRLLPLCSAHRRRWQDLGVAATRDGKPGRNSPSEFPRDDAAGGKSFNDGSRRRGGRKTRRPWWDVIDGDIYQDQDEYPLEQKRGILDEFVDSFWFFKLLGTYGWSLPIIMLSLLLANGPRAFLTAMLFPVGLSVLTFAYRLLRIWTQGTSSEYRPWTKKKSSTGKMKTAFMEENEGKMRWTKDPRMQHGAFRPSRGNGSAAYGGWEELIDEEVLATRNGEGLGTIKDDEALGTRSGQGLGTRKEEMKAPPPQEELDGRVQVRDQPLVFRLLVALFPFLSSWVDLL